MAIISKSSEYGLRAALYIAARPVGDYVSIGEMSQKLGISFHFLTKILQKLTQGGLLKSRRGAKGGIALAKPADTISLLDIVENVDGADLFGGCILGLVGCGVKRPCPLHQHWSRERTRIEAMFRKMTLQRLACETARNQLRLAD
ncbi:MAG: Rrf2 family transcriptional regulator [Kiritimatiellae bacterium]|nr:Rrf2 family transcriptional regulator [Kiritimatiellia bacterium]MDD4340659.1 Rrf2 family transcriptional regulator [Kiritimatiellia bacterium]MDY0148477.1 Rrf2 family transcriptional regulator [Kiritimatiellia bacterium]